MLGEQLPFSQACENNKEPILQVLQKYLTGDELVLEIGSGTGQHAVHFCQHFPQLLWQPTDRAENLENLEKRISSSKLTNLIAAICLDVDQEVWPRIQPDIVFTANSLHIMSERSMTKFFHGVGRVLSKDGKVLIYGPLKYQGDFSTESNANFDLWLKQQNQESGVRDFEAILQLAVEAELRLLKDHAMPANNQLLVFQHI